MGSLARGWEARGVHKRRRIRPSIAQRLGVVAGDVPTWPKSSRAALRERQDAEQDDDEEEEEESAIPSGKKRRQDIGGDGQSVPTVKGKEGKGKGKDNLINVIVVDDNDNDDATAPAASDHIKLELEPELDNVHVSDGLVFDIIGHIHHHPHHHIHLHNFIYFNTTTIIIAAPTSNAGAVNNGRSGLSSGATAGIIAGVLSAFLLLIGGICLCSRRARSRLVFLKGARLLKTPSRKDSREHFHYGTTTTFISGPEESMPPTRSLSIASLRSNAAHQTPRSNSSAASNRAGITEDERFSIMSGLRQHPVSFIPESEASFEPDPPANPSSNASVIAGRDSLRPFPATRGFGMPRESFRASGQTWPIKEALESPRSDQFEYDSSDPNEQQKRMTDVSSVAESMFNRISQATSTFGGSGLSPPPPPLPTSVNDNNPFLNKPQVPGMVYLPTRLTGLQQQQQQQQQQEAPRTIQPVAFAHAGPGGWGEGRQPPANRLEANESSGESLVEVTDLRRVSPPLPSPGSRFSRPTSSESEGVTSEASSDEYGSETRGLMRTTGFGVSSLPDDR
ncbi:hypothetical protein N0V93_007849 [Gnomoniopsis smithogilvyi]|uniref:Uncharacterized protein n=1 Tax=Gnomoniopsis smithogilvyi TaxID=1191159 RepID=A0A9W8YKL9_9PEZI|nr:hypothetical protein N0V93_007849 [Gnomoniopsis smithogilvyi]